MKKIIGLLLAMSTSMAFAATTGNLLLQGTVPALLSIEVTAEALASSLPLDTTQTDSKVATVNEKSNSNTGYKVNISSANAGALVHESVASSFINYTITYDGSAVDLANGDEFVYNTSAKLFSFLIYPSFSSLFQDD